MIEAALLAAILWFGILTLRAADSVRWWLAGFDLALIALAFGMVRRLAIRFHPVGVLLAIAAVWALVQVRLGISVDPQRTLEAALGWTIDCAAFSIALAALKRDHVRRRFLYAQALFGLVVGAGCVVWLYTAAALGPFAYKNQFAAYLESVMGIAIAAAIPAKTGRPRLSWILAAAAMFACAAAGGSRAGAILCLAELIVLPLIAYLRGWIRGRTLIQLASLAVAGAAVLVMVTGWETVWRRLQEPNPYAVRADLLRSSVAMARDRPIGGFGLGAWPSAYPGYARYDDGTFVNQAHNDWAQWAVEGGLPFLGLMLAVVAMLIRPALDSLWGVGLLAVFVHAWIDYPFEQRPALAAFFFAMAGALIASAEAYRPGESFRL